MERLKSLQVSTIIFLIFALVACGVLGNAVLGKIKWPFNSWPTTEIIVTYAPEEELYIKDAIKDFNDTYAKGVNPVTGEKLPEGQKGFSVKGVNASSGTVKTQFVNALVNNNYDGFTKPTIFSPSVSHWLSLINFETNREVFKLDESVPTANAPVVIAIWESRLNAIKDKNPGKEIGWEELLQVLNSPNGWSDFNSSFNRKKVYYGHTDPNISSTALSTLASEYLSSTKYLVNNPNLDTLTVSNVQDPKVQEGVRNIEKLIKHYSSRTTEFKEYIAQGPNYLDFVALEENDLIFINQGKTQYKPTEKLVALYPKEGTFVHEHPFAIPNVDWVTDEQRQGAKIFTDYILSEKVQQKVVENGFRPANKNVKLLDNPGNLGVDWNQPKALIKTPTAETFSKLQQSWNFVKKRGEVTLLVDTSGSMDGGKMTNAKEALKSFATNLPPQTVVALNAFADTPREVVGFKSLENNRNDLINGINSLNANGGTSIYDALLTTLEKLEKEENKSDEIRAIVLLSDGEDTTSKARLDAITAKLESLQKSDSPIFVIPIAYGGGADTNALNSIARASSTKVQKGDTKDIAKLLEVISSYF